MNYINLKECIEFFIFNMKGLDQAHKYTPV